MKTCSFLSLLAILLFSSNGTLALLRSKHDKVVTCYVASWAVYRPNNGKFGVDHIRPELCTHLVYAFAGLSNTTWTITSLDPGMDIENGGGNYKRMTQLRKRYPHLHILLAIGGWNENSKQYSILASSPELRSLFINGVLKFLREYDFDGFDLDWEYPASRGGAPTDKENFVSLVKELKQAFKEQNYLLTAAISANRGTIGVAYDIPELSKYLDYIHVMAYDYHGTWDGKVLPNAPLKSENGQSVMDTLKYLVSEGLPPSKTVLGLPMYGRTFILRNKLNSSLESPINQPTLPDGFNGSYTGQNGFMGYNEICEELVTHPESWRTGWDDDSETAYAIKDDHVIVFDNAKSLKAKADLVMSLNLSGVMIWSIDTDDFTGKCDRRDTFPLLNAINAALISPNNNVHHANNNNNGHNSSSITRFSHSFILIILASFVRYI